MAIRVTVCVQLFGFCFFIAQVWLTVRVAIHRGKWPLFISFFALFIPVVIPIIVWLFPKPDSDVPVRSKLPRNAALLSGMLFLLNNGIIVWAALNPSSEAYFDTGLEYDEGLNGHPKDLAKALANYSFAADQGNGSAEVNLGLFYMDGDGVPVDETEAERLFRKSIYEHNSSDGLVNLGLLCRRQGRFDEGAELIKKSAELGNPRGEAFYGRTLIQSNPADAKMWLDRAVAKNDAWGYGFRGALKDYEGDVTGAFEDFKKSADGGSGLGQELLAQCYFLGQGTPKDIGLGLKSRLKAVDQHYPIAECNLGLDCVDGTNGCPKDLPTAVELLKRAANHGSGQAAFALGKMFLEGVGVAKNLDVADKLFHRAVTLQFVEAYYYIGVFSQNKNEFETALEAFLRGAQAGIPKCEGAVSLYYMLGRGTPVDEQKGVSWAQKGAAQGDPVAEGQLARAYCNGIIVEKDQAEGAAWYRKAATQGNIEAEWHYGVILLHGDGTGTDETAGLQYLQLASAAGEVGAMLEIGKSYATGLGVKQDFAKAKEFYQKAARLGSSEAAKRLQELPAEEPSPAPPSPSP